MSAVPLAALVLGGTWALPSSVAFILSARAGPAKAIAAPSANVTSMVLFDMVFLPVDIKRPCQPQNNDFTNLFPKRRQTPEISWKPLAQSAFILAIEFAVLDYGSVNAATNAPWLDPCRHRRRRHLLVADGPGGRCPGLACSPHAEPRQWPHNVQCRRLFRLPCRSQPARSAEARRRACNAVAVRDVLRSQHLVRSHLRHRPVERSGFCDGGAQGDVAGRRALFSGLSICVLPACDGRRRPRPLCLPEDASAGCRQAARPRRAISIQYPPQCRRLEMAVHGRQALHGGRLTFGVMESRRLPRQRPRPLRRVP